MKRLCSNCKKTLGEKCARCGSEDVHILVTVPAADIDLWGCLGCGNNWIGGEDGETHGLCEPCLNVAKAALRREISAGRDMA